ncbi:MAG TPA: hypothetical protein GXZ90_03170 [Clostridiales bacterium]|nr:hypothetical protein [Clostridiales bacterium]
MENKYMVIINPKMARMLLKQGFKVVDIKPHKTRLNASVFVFENKEGLSTAMQEYINEK